jgi:hypothetical protein
MHHQHHMLQNVKILEESERDQLVFTVEETNKM